MAEREEPEAREPGDPGDAHRRAWDAIPWVVGGSATADEQAWLQQHLAGCEACREELAFEQALRQSMQNRPGPAVDTDAAWHGLQARIEAGTAITTAITTATEGDAGARGPAPRRAPWLVRGLVAAVVLQSVGLATAMLALREQGRDGAEYRTFSTAAAARPASLRLVVAPGMDMATLRALLAAQRLTIVDAAADASSFGLVPVDGQQATLTAALAVLRAHPGVLLAESTGHAPR